MKYLQRSALSLGYTATALAYEYMYYGSFNFKYVCVLNTVGLLFSINANFDTALKKSTYLACALSALSIPFFMVIGAGVGYIKSDATEIYSLPAYKFINGFISNLAPLVTGATLGVLMKNDSNYEACINFVLRMNNAVKDRLEVLKDQMI